MLESKKFGRQISHSEGDKYFKRYVKIKEKHGKALRAYFKDDPEAERFFCGRKAADPKNEDWAYIFDPLSIERFMKAMKDMDGDSIVIFQGVRDKEPDDEESESNGRPTLLLFPAKIKEVQKDGRTIRVFQVAETGEEHPGTSGGTPEGPLTEAELPTSIPIESIHKFRLM